MSSAATLRRFGKGTAAVATAALVMTAFGPAAFAWVAPTPAPTHEDKAGAASIGLIDVDPGAAGTQGATAVAGGADNQAIGDVRFVLPSTWRTGDYVEFTLGRSSGSVNTTVTDQVYFAADPAVTIDPKPYAATTHVAATSPTSAGSDVLGATEAGNQTPYTGTAAVAAPQYSVTLRNNTTTGRPDRVRITFNNTQTIEGTGAKFIGAIRGARINVGSGVTDGHITLAGAAYDQGTTTAVTTAMPFFGSGTAGKNVTIPATVAKASLNVVNGGFVADGTNQNVGPITVQAAIGEDLEGGLVTVVLAGGRTFVSEAGTVTYYNEAGRVLNPGGTEVTPAGASLATPANPPTGTTRVVFSGLKIAGSITPGTVEYQLTSAGTITLPTNPLSAANVNQTDIQAPGIVFRAAVNRTAVPERLGGSSRYQTAVKIAEAKVGTTPGQIMGEADNVVLATGQEAADALSAGYLAATKNAPILLTRTNMLEPEVKEFLRNYGAKNVYIVGGHSAISPAVERELRDTQANDIQGVSATSQQQLWDVAVSGLPTGYSVSPTTPLTGLPNDPALTGTGLTIARDATDDVDATTTTFLGVTATSISGGSAGATGTATFSIGGRNIVVNFPAVATSGRAAGDDQGDAGVTQVTTTRQVTTEVVSEGSTAVGSNRRVVPLNTNLNVQRLAGNSRWETNRRVNEYAAQTSAAPMGTTVAKYGEARKNTAILANGYTGIIDALSAGPLVGNSAGQNPMPIILTMGNRLHHEAREQMNTLTVRHVLAVGGTSVIPDSVVEDNLGATVMRLGGANRWETAAAVADFAVRSDAAGTTNVNPGLGLRGDRPLLANGAHPRADGWADALTSGPLAVKRATFIAIASQSYLPSETRDLLRRHRSFLDEVTAIGLANAVGNNVVDDANAALG